MYYQILSGIVSGVRGQMISIEVDASNGMPYFSMVGYLSSEVKEAKERVMSALRSVSFALPPKRITVNLSPANIKKAGSSFDFPIAIAILGSFQKFPQEKLKGSFAAGEISLDGSIRSVKGILPMVLEAKRQKVTTCYIPKENQKEVIGVQGIDIYLVSSLAEFLDYLKGKTELEKLKPKQFEIKKRVAYPDFSDVKGQFQVKRALEIAATGRHNILLVGPAGCGKSLLSKCLLGVIPPLEKEEYEEIRSIYSAKGMKYEWEGYPPIRMPHHSIPPASFLGGGNHLQAGEVTLAHHGILLLDELPEFKRTCLEGLREPMEEHCISISRNGNHEVFPADFMILATMNHCPCGNYPNLQKCTCSFMQRKRYQNRLSRPLLERFDMILRVKAIDLQEEKILESKAKDEMTSEVIYQHILYGRNKQKMRYEKENFHYNSRIPSSKIEEACKMDGDTAKFSKMIFGQKELSMREFHHMLRVARSIADLEGAEEISMAHVAEAASYYMREDEEV